MDAAADTACLTCETALWLPRTHWCCICSDPSISWRPCRGNLAAVAPEERARLRGLRLAEDAASSGRRSRTTLRVPRSDSVYTEAASDSGESEDSDEILDDLLQTSEARGAVREQTAALLDQTHVKLRDHCGLVQGLAVKRASALKIAGAASHAALRDFLVKALEFHPPERLTPASALRHAWLSPPPADGEPDVVLDDRQTLETWEADDDAVSTVQRATAENLPVGPGEWQAEP